MRSTGGSDKAKPQIDELVGYDKNTNPACAGFVFELLKDTGSFPSRDYSADLLEPFKEGIKRLATLRLAANGIASPSRPLVHPFATLATRVL